MKLQTARQGKNESPQEFADRCRVLAQKITCKVDDPRAQQVHRENAERMLLASFVAGLTGVPGRQVRYTNPQTIQQALRLALSVQEAEKQERFNNSFIRSLIVRLAYIRDPTDERTVKVKVQNTQLQRVRRALL